MREMNTPPPFTALHEVKTVVSARVNALLAAIVIASAPPSAAAVEFVKEVEPVIFRVEEAGRVATITAPLPAVRLTFWKVHPLTERLPVSEGEGLTEMMEVVNSNCVDGSTAEGEMVSELKLNVPFVTTKSGSVMTLLRLSSMLMLVNVSDLAEQTKCPVMSESAETAFVTELVDELLETV